LWTPLFTVFSDLSRVVARDPPFLIYEGKTEVGQYTSYTGSSRLPTSIRFGERVLMNVKYPAAFEWGTRLTWAELLIYLLLWDELVWDCWAEAFWTVMVLASTSQIH
jgi:hypothetical protein